MAMSSVDQVQVHTVETKEIESDQTLRRLTPEDWEWAPALECAYSDLALMIAQNLIS